MNAKIITFFTCACVLWILISTKSLKGSDFLTNSLFIALESLGDLDNVSAMNMNFSPSLVS